MVYRFLPLNGLRAFEAAARHRSFKKAADELFVTPTAVSHQIKTLEDCLGVQLFHRLTRALALTTEGEAILPKVSEGLACLAKAVEQTRDPRKVGTLSVTAPPAFAARWLVPRLRGFTAAYPEVQLHLSSSFKTIDGGDRGGLLPIEAIDTHDGSTRIAIRFGLGHYPGCRVDLIFSADYYPVCSPSLLKAKRPLRNPQDLRWHVLIQDDTIPDEANRPTWEEWFKVAGVEDVNPHVGPHFSDVSLALEAACDGQGVALAMEPVARAEIAAGRLLIPFVTPLRARFAFYLVVPAALAERPAVAAFRHWLLEEARKEPSRSPIGPPVAA
jgi:LysR family glycine cleavage system transcriptional activator